MTLSKARWNRKYSNGYIYGTYPSETAIKTAQLLVKEGLAGQKTKILEIGGGYGRNSLYFNKQIGADVTAVDFSSTAIVLGHKLAKTVGGCTNFVNGNIMDLANFLEKSNYDIVFHNFCLHLIPKKDRKKIYKNLAFVLKPKGLLIGSHLSVDDPDCQATSLKNENGLTRFVRGIPQHFFTSVEIREELNGYFLITKMAKSSDPEKIIEEVRATNYFFVVAKSK